MKALIAYATKYGATYEIARRIASRVGDATLHDLSVDGPPDIEAYGCIIVGSSLYAGMARKEAKVFVKQNIDALKGKRLGLFFSGLEATKQTESLKANYPADILSVAITAEHIGGIFDPKKANLAERLIMKAASGDAGFQDTIDDEKIASFVEELRAGQRNN
jgi:menaquinone-dependent protoporphyrinogen oxidase